MPTGALAAAANNLRRRIALCREIEDRFGEAIGHQEYGLLLIYCGDWARAAAELDTALEQFTAEDHPYAQGVVYTYRAQAALLQGKAETANASMQEGLQFIDAWARTRYPVERGYVEAHWLLGWARLLLGDLEQA